MKTTILVLSLLFSTAIIGQDIAQEPPQYVFCNIVGTGKLMSKKVTIEIDFGEKMQFFADNRLKDPKTGKNKVFNSMVDALNYMGKSGWDFEQAYVVSYGNQNVYNYLMKKPFLKLDKEAQDEFMKNDD